MQTVILLLLASVLIVVELVRRSRYRSLKHIRGPPVPSWVFGHEYMLTRQQEAGEFDFPCVKEYGLTWRIGGLLGGDQIMTADPKALQHILHKSGYNYPKRRDVSKMSEVFSGGPGITSAIGEVHQRQRKIMNPAFSATQLRRFLPLFQETGLKLCEKWEKEVITVPNKTVYVNKWLARTTLDIIGAAAFDYSYGALDEKENALSKSYSTLFLDSTLYQSKLKLFYRIMWHYLPDWVINILMNAPTRELKRVRSTSRLFREVAGNLLREKGSEAKEKAEEGYKDVLSILVRANASEEPRSRLSDKEMKAQMQTLTLAGHETTASSVSWMLLELARHPEYQARLRAEIRARREVMRARGDIRFTVEDLDSLTLLNNAIKETLRYHPIVLNLHRYALKDDIIPLQEPIVSTTGEVVDAIPIKAGQWIKLSLCAYNRLPSVWGENPDVWNPDRFFRIDPTKQTKLGVYANLVSFSGGVRSCIGWRFALIEMQALASELLEKFEFSLPKDEVYDIQRLPAGMMIPLVRGKWHLGSVMPLCVTAVP
ncbi:cytochrome P450 [Lentinus tigrinus ALCF2SS1-7]|uniref:Cytochrome P450 n=1 Tax=Lentinus tigrinus ALCF2SS1-6 TaxID=1328759 RepID=A0A5C2SM21_9APHY|nr:cytochrome P450 [Lentinus tigrinus ALCF2SS1-6]RPD81957.1 cytochrome P450 [Lentinus tigrinus ALCF2SS1-7]